MQQFACCLIERSSAANSNQIDLSIVEGRAVVGVTVSDRGRRGIDAEAETINLPAESFAQVDQRGDFATAEIKQSGRDVFGEEHIRC